MELSTYNLPSFPSGSPWVWEPRRLPLTCPRGKNHLFYSFGTNAELSGRHLGSKSSPGSDSLPLRVLHHRNRNCRKSSPCSVHTPCKIKLRVGIKTFKAGATQAVQIDNAYLVSLSQGLEVTAFECLFSAVCYGEILAPPNRSQWTTWINA